MQGFGTADSMPLAVAVLVRCTYADLTNDRQKIHIYIYICNTGTQVSFGTDGEACAAEPLIFTSEGPNTRGVCLFVCCLRTDRHSVS
jgi:hypothetical protein